MTQKQYLKDLKRNLRSLKKADKNEIIAFYKESIADRMEAGKSEEAAVAELESPAEVAARCLAEYGKSFEEHSGGNKNGEVKALKITLIIVTFPVWLTVACIVISLYVAFFAVAAGLILGGSGFFGYGVYYAFVSVAEGLSLMGMGLTAVPLGILLFMGLIKLTALLIKKFKGKKIKESI